MSSPDLTEAERQAVAAVLRTPNLSMGGESWPLKPLLDSKPGEPTPSVSTRVLPGCTCVCTRPALVRVTW